MNNEVGKFTVLPLLDLAQAANTAAATGAAKDIKDYTGNVKIVLSVLAGGTGSVDVKIQHSDTTTAGDFVDLDPAVAFTQVTTGASRQEKLINVDACKRYIRVVGTIATGPQTLGVDLIGTKKVLP